ncbi:MAG: ScyD/ScyE family protein [Pirellulaceae bacterium]
MANTTSFSTNRRSTLRRVAGGVALVAIAVAASAGWVLSRPQEATITRVATGLENPRGIAALPDGRLLVVEAGDGRDTDDASEESGRVSIFEDLNRDGDFDDASEIVPMLSEIASYNTIAGVGVGHDEVGGAGDIISLDDGSFFFTRDDPTEGYAPDGSTRGINVVEVGPDFRMKGNLIVRNVTLNALAFDPRAEIFYVAESGANRLTAVTMDGTARTVVEFPRLAQGQEAVPAGLAIDPTTGDVLVALFSGNIDDYFGTVLPYMPGAAKIVRVDPATGEQADAVTGLTTAVDVAVDENGNIFVVEFTSDWPPAPTPRDFDRFDPNAAPDPGGYDRFAGSVTLYPADGTSPLWWLDGLDLPTNITYADGALYVSTGQGTPGRPIIGPDGLTRIVGEIYRIVNFPP